MNKEYEEKFHVAFGGQHFLGEQVAGPERVFVGCDELLPSLLARLRINPVLFEQVTDRAPADAVYLDLLEFAKDACVTPAGVLPGQAEDELLNLGLGAWTTGLLLSLAGVAGLRLLGDPAGEGSGRDDGDQILDGVAQRFAELDETLLLGIGDADLLGQLAAEDFVLNLEKLDLFDELGVGGVSQHEEQRGHNPGHGLNFRKSLCFQGETQFPHPASGAENSRDSGSAGEGPILALLDGRNSSGTRPAREFSLRARNIRALTDWLTDRRLVFRRFYFDGAR